MIKEKASREVPMPQTPFRVRHGPLLCMCFPWVFCGPLFGPFVSILGISENHQKTLFRRRDPPGDMEKQRFPQKLVFLEITKMCFFLKSPQLRFSENHPKCFFLKPRFPHTRNFLEITQMRVSEIAQNTLFWTSPKVRF